MSINAAGEQLIKSRESLRLTAYLCPAGVPTIGWGHIKGVTQAMVDAKYTIREVQAQVFFENDIAEAEAAVHTGCEITPTENEKAAMVSLAFNIGTAAFETSSVLAAHNRGDSVSAARAFALWNKATVNGKKVVLAGLVARRAEEAALYLKPNEGEATAPSAQAVEPEKPMGSSVIVQGGTIAAAGSALGAAAQAAQQLASIRDSLGSWLPYAFLAVTFVAGVWIVYNRFVLRRTGAL